MADCFEYETQVIPLHGGIAVVVEDDRLIATVALRDIEAAAAAATSARAAIPRPVGRPSPS